MSDFRGFSFCDIACLKSDLQCHLRQMDATERNQISSKRYWTPERITEVFSDASRTILSRKRNALPTILRLAYDVLIEQRFSIERETFETSESTTVCKRAKTVHVEFGVVSQGVRLVCRARVWICRDTCQRRMDAIEFELCRALRHNNVAVINAWDKAFAKFSSASSSAQELQACQQELDRLQPMYERALYIVKLTQQLLGELQRLEEILVSVTR
jgi:hypothetical protein